MELSSQVASLELSRKLKELGVKQDSSFYWEENTLYAKLYKNAHNSEVYLVNTIDFGEWYEEERFKNGFTNIYSAFTVVELGEMLQESPRAGITMAYNKVFNLTDSTTITPEGLVMCLLDVNIVAKMLIYLSENNLISL